jgi:hypothetical protein
MSAVANSDPSMATGKNGMQLSLSQAGFDGNLRLERSVAGRAIARQRQVQFGRPPKLTPSLVRQVMLAHEETGFTPSANALARRSRTRSSKRSFRGIANRYRSGRVSISLRSSAVFPHLGGPTRTYTLVIFVIEVWSIV